MKDFLELCSERFSARLFTQEAVSDADLHYVLEAVRLAPSAVNRQPWRWVVVKSGAMREKVQRAYDREWFRTAPIYIIGMKEKGTEWVRGYDQKPHGDVDLAIATEHLCLAATERGLGTCWVCNFDPVLLQELLPQPEGWEAVVIVPLGHIAPDCPRKEKVRKPLDEIIEIL
ncbi:MAG: nitroreductase family protein [Bacteroidales bacterium]|nr:nitroreductase family protein [Bacteroidales bacterium]